MPQSTPLFSGGTFYSGAPTGFDALAAALPPIGQTVAESFERRRQKALEAKAMAEEQRRYMAEHPIVAMPDEDVGGIKIPAGQYPLTTVAGIAEKHMAEQDRIANQQRLKEQNAASHQVGYFDASGEFHWPTGKETIDPTTRKVTIPVSTSSSVTGQPPLVTNEYVGTAAQASFPFQMQATQAATRTGEIKLEQRLGWANFGLRKQEAAFNARTAYVDGNGNYHPYTHNTSVTVDADGTTVKDVMTGEVLGKLKEQKATATKTKNPMNR